MISIKRILGMFVIAIPIYFAVVSYIPVAKNQKIVVMEYNIVNKFGIGNQLFKYAAAYALAKRIGAELWIVNPHNDRSFTSDDRNFVLDEFNIIYDKYISSIQYEYILLRYPLVEVNEKNFYDVKEGDGQIFHIHGYFESERFFANVKEDIQKITIKIPLVTSDKLAKVASTESVAVHVRRGDFIKENLLPLNYKELLKLENFDAFFEYRKRKLVNKLKNHFGI